MRKFPQKTAWKSKNSENDEFHQMNITLYRMKKQNFTRKSSNPFSSILHVVQIDLAKTDKKNKRRVR